MYQNELRIPSGNSSGRCRRGVLLASHIGMSTRLLRLLRSILYMHLDPKPSCKQCCPSLLRHGPRRFRQLLHRSRGHCGCLERIPGIVSAGRVSSLTAPPTLGLEPWATVSALRRKKHIEMGVACYGLLQWTCNAACNLRWRAQP